MKILDIESWDRKNHYHYFKTLDYPHFNVCANVDITRFYRSIKEREIPFFLSTLYAVVKTANEIKEFRYRIRGEQVVEHESVSPSFTVMTLKQVFSFCTVEFIEDYTEFFAVASAEMEKVKNLVSIEDERGRDDLLYITSIPWVSFTSITHPVHMSPGDCIPRISWGKYFEENGKWKLPLSVQAHHALMDGAHVGQYFNNLQELLDNTDRYL